jgi:hypothetical protein
MTSGWSSLSESGTPQSQIWGMNSAECPTVGRYDSILSLRDDIRYLQ